MTSEKHAPLVFVVGDSISLHYGPFLKAGLGEAFSYARKGGEEEAFQNLDIPAGANGGDSSMVLDYLTSLFAQKAFCPDLLLVNCGLHDIKTSTETGAIQIPLETYRRNLETLVARSRERGMPLVWIRTTHSVDAIHNGRSLEFHRFSRDNDRYDATALEVMAAGGVPVIDLRTFTRTLGADEELFVDHVHFSEPVRQQQGAFIAGWLQGWRAARNS